MMDDTLELINGYLDRQLNFNGFPGNGSYINFDFAAFKNLFILKQFFSFENIRLRTLIHSTGIQNLLPTILLCFIHVNNFNLMSIKVIFILNFKLLSF